MIHGLSKNVRVLQVYGGTTASATTTLDSSVIDRSGYDSVMLIGSLGSTAADSGMDLLVSTSSSTAQAEDVLNSRVSALGSTGLVLDVAKLPVGKRYLFGRYVRGNTANTAGKMVAVLYNNRIGPVDNATSTVQAVQFLGNASTGQSTSTSST